MSSSGKTGFEGDPKRWHWGWRYALPFLLFGITVGLSWVLSQFGIRFSMAIPIVLAVVATGWFGGRGPGVLIGLLFQCIAIAYGTVPTEGGVLKAAFAHFSVFALYILLAFLMDHLRRVQYRLRHQRDVLQVTLSSIGDGVITTDTAGNVVFMNPTAERLTGWGREEAAGRPLPEVMRIVNETSREAVTNPVEKVLSTGRTVGLANHTLIIARDGREFPIDDSAAPIMDRENVIGVVLVFADVSARKQAERARRESAIMQGLVDAQESERRRIARDLHDHLGQRMTALRMRIESLTEKCAGNSALETEIDEVQNAAAQIDRDIAFLSWELRPTELENLGLTNALTSFVREWSRQYSIPAEFHSNGFNSGETVPVVPKNVETNLYRIVQEALNNILKHSGARSANVLLQRRQDEVVLIVEDDGRGFDRDSGPLDASRLGGQGLIGMHERAAVMGGTLEIDTGNGNGTTIVVRVPVAGAPTVGVAAAAS